VVESAGHRNATSGQWTEAGAHFFEGRAPSRANHLHEFRKAMGIGIFIDSSTAFYSKFQKRDSPLVVQELQ